MDNSLLNQIKGKIENDQLEQALVLLDQYIRNETEVKEPIRKRIIMYILSWRRQLKSLNDNIRSGTISNEEERVETNKISKSIIDLFQDIEAKNFKPYAHSLSRIEAPESAAGLGLLILFPLFLVILFLLVQLGNRNYSSNEQASRQGNNSQEALDDSWKVMGDQFIGKDNMGRKGIYVRYYVRGYYWKLGEIAVAEQRNSDKIKIESVNICDALIAGGIPEKINKKPPRKIIVFGNASCEEDNSLPDSIRLTAEEDRARFRGEKLAKCVNAFTEVDSPIDILNLGQYQVFSHESLWQREILIVGIIKEEPGTLTPQALYDGLEKSMRKLNPKLDLANYSRVDPAKPLPLEYYSN